MDCKGNVSTCPHTQGCECKRWIIKLLDRSGKEWGQIKGNSVESVKKQLEDSQKWEENDARFFEIPNKELYSNPSDPICDACMNLSKRSKDVETAYTAVERAFDHWVSKLKGLRDGLRRSEVKQLITRSSREGGRDYKAGTILKEYAEALWDATVKLRNLEKQLTSSMGRESSVVGYGSDGALMIDLNYLKGVIESEEASIDRRYYDLPRDVRELLEGQE
jgi:hypothetical protein